MDMDAGSAPQVNAYEQSNVHPSNGFDPDRKMLYVSGSWLKRGQFLKNLSAVTWYSCKTVQAAKAVTFLLLPETSKTYVVTSLSPESYSM